MEFKVERLSLQERAFRFNLCSGIWKAGLAIDEFLEDFPSVTREQVIQLLKLTNKMVNTPQVIELYEIVA